MRIRVFVLALTLAAGAASMPARASTGSVNIFNNVFDPNNVEAIAGETVTWHWNCGDLYGSGPCSNHNVTAYSGASFASPTQSGATPTYTFTLSTTGEIKYRCTIHSTLSGSVCQGMCGAIEPDLFPPTIRITSSPKNGIATGPVDFGGDMKDNRAVASAWLHVAPPVGPAVDQPIACAVCPSGGQIFWTSTLTLGPGLYTVTPHARDINNYEGVGPAVTLLVL